MTLQLDSLNDSCADSWIDGFGIIAPDVERYIHVLRDSPDPLLDSIQDSAKNQNINLLDPETAKLISLFLRAHRPRNVLEIGTGLGYVTTHIVRNVIEECIVTSIEPDPMLQSQAKSFLTQEDPRCLLELRLGESTRLLSQELTNYVWDILILNDPSMDRLELLDKITPQLAEDALVVIPWALYGGRVANNEAVWSGDTLVEKQRMLNRYVATNPSFADVTLIPSGDGVILARVA